MGSAQVKRSKKINQGVHPVVSLLPTPNVGKRTYERERCPQIGSLPRRQAVVDMREMAMGERPVGELGGGLIDGYHPAVVGLVLAVC